MKTRKLYRLVSIINDGTYQRFVVYRGTYERCLRESLDLTRFVIEEAPCYR